MVTSGPLVSVVCLCYNQSKWVEQAIDSVLRQTYPNIEIILADDASTDGSQAVIEKIKDEHPEIKILLSAVNRGNCVAFNAAFHETKGDYIVDLAADDVMKPDRIEKQLARFNALDERYGVVFTDAEYIDATGKFIRGHYSHLRRKRLLDVMPEGNVYRKVLSRYFIAAPTMLVRRIVFERLGGYDESLAYEDFDFWVRSSREFYYAYVNEPLTLIRKLGGSMSTGWYKRGDRMLHSTYVVCRKAVNIGRDDEDRRSLVQRVRYELKQSVLTDNRNEAILFYDLLRELGVLSPGDRILGVINRVRLPMSGLRRLYHAVRYR